MNPKTKKNSNLINVKVSEEDRAYLTKLSELKNISVSDIIRDALITEVAKKNIEQAWNKSYQQYHQSKQKQELKPPYISQPKPYKFMLTSNCVEPSEDFVQIVINDFAAQITLANSPFLGGFRIDKNNSSQWIYKFGQNYILCLVEDLDIVILDILSF